MCCGQAPKAAEGFWKLSTKQLRILGSRLGLTLVQLLQVMFIHVNHGASPQRRRRLGKQHCYLKSTSNKLDMAMNTRIACPFMTQEEKGLRIHEARLCVAFRNRIGYACLMFYM
ncbi:hypothetical protein DFH27DRAFT_526112 [Peziza echinospora]|nr:hypothetical protein DFH27DRAFT_526112 [Peziza echinospora]